MPSSSDAVATTTRVVPLYAPKSVFGDRFSQLDVALNKTFDLGVTRLVARLDLYNALNGNPVESYNQAFIAGGAWLVPQGILTARFAKINMQVDF